MKKSFNKIFVASVISSLFCFASCELPSYGGKDITPGSNNSVAKKEYSSITIAPVDATLGNDFMRGVDVSEVKALEEAGIRFYDTDNSQKDVFAILAAHGVNWVRIRLWNDYTKGGEVDPNWYPYGSNDMNRTLNMATRAKKYGMKVLLDLHYSDTWADPGKQYCPDMWKNIDSIAGLSVAVADWTKEVLEKMESEGVLPEMIQLGNEMEGGIFKANTAVSVSIADSAEILNAAAKAVREVSEKIEIMLHMSAGGDSGRLTNFYNNFISKVDCDVVGLSYYPYYSNHRSVESLAQNVNTIKSTYGKKAVVAEVSYGYSLDAWSDNTSNTFYETQEETSANNMATYKGVTTRSGTSTKIISASIENQAGVVREVIEQTAKNGCDGIFYWGGCYLGVEGVLQSSWENQALFDTDGKVLPSLDVLAVKGK